MSSVLEKARQAWGESIPDWVVVLAEEADRTSQNQVAKRLKRTAPLISTVVNNKYGAGLAQIETQVRGVLMRETIMCPGFGEDITKDICKLWRDRSRSFSGHNPLRVKLYRACNRCPRNQQEAKS